MTFEHILIVGVKDTDEQARELAKIGRGLSAKINLIRCNTVEGLEWSRPSRALQERFQSILREHGVVATLRREKGHSESSKLEEGNPPKSVPAFQAFSAPHRKKFQLRSERKMNELDQLRAGNVAAGLSKRIKALWDCYPTTRFQ
jgi:hypothetical protein